LLKYNFKIYDEIKLTNLYTEINKEYLESTKLYFSDKKGLNLRNERNLIYYISTGFPKTYYEVEKHLKEDLKEVDTVLISGHLPHGIFVKDIKKPFYFICYEDTVLPKNIESLDEEDKYSIASYILNNPKDVKSYVHVKQNGEKTFFDQYKENKGCKFCGETCSICLDFHHKDPTQKDRNVSRMKNSSHSIKAIKKEIHKCIVVCSNCHRKLHAGMIHL
jgi:hypothetical protein